MTLLNPKIGMRVLTPNDGPGTIVEQELLTKNINKEMWNIGKPTWELTERWGVKLDVNLRPWPVSYYWLKELKEI